MASQNDRSLQRYDLTVKRFYPSFFPLIKTFLSRVAWWNSPALKVRPKRSKHCSKPGYIHLSVPSLVIYLLKIIFLKTFPSSTRHSLYWTPPVRTRPPLENQPPTPSPSFSTVAVDLISRFITPPQRPRRCPYVIRFPRDPEISEIVCVLRVCVDPLFEAIAPLLTTQYSQSLTTSALSPFR